MSLRAPDLDHRGSKDILRQIQKTAAAYTPEWRFDEQNLDVGTALAMLFSDMFAGTLNRFNRVPEQHRVAFLNEIGARMLPAIPAYGYAVFGLSREDAGGFQVEAGTRIVADTEDDENHTLIFETANDVYVTPATVRDVFCSSGELDCICRLFQDVKDTALTPFCLFDFRGENLQQHAFYLAHRDALQISGASRVELTFFPFRKNRFSRAQLDALLDLSSVRWEYSTRNGFVPFDAVTEENGTLIFEKSGDQAIEEAEIFNEKSYWMRCTVKKAAPLADFVIDRAEISAAGARIRPTVILAAGVEQNVSQCFPFGEKMALFNDVYFACEEALSKRGAMVRLEFNLNFMKIPVELDIADPSVDWKLIMKRSDFTPDREYDITIEQVIWEYFNGQGWSRLFLGEQQEDCFTTEKGTVGQFRSIMFRCPKDMTPILVGSCESCYLRARVLKINNAFKMKGSYIAPFIDEVCFSYTYGADAVLPEHLITVNQLEEKRFNAGDLLDKSVSIAPVFPLEEPLPAVCFGFEHSPRFGPIKILFKMDSELSKEPPRLVWEYWNGKKWAGFSPYDETKQFSKTGILTFAGNGDFAPRRLFGTERYWVRAVDEAKFYAQPDTRAVLPRVTGIYMNATQIVHVLTHPTELFYMEPHQINAAFRLLHDSVQDLCVEINELSELSETELEALEQQGLVRAVRSPLGKVTEAWVRWTQVDNFSGSAPNDRHYMAEKNSGRIFFSDGTAGRVPTGGTSETVAVTYSTGGGEKGNLNAQKINRTELSLGFVNRVTNPTITAGGCDQETIAQAAVRTAAALGHGYRAVTAGDYEQLVFEATRAVWKAKCFAGYNDRGRRQAGAVTLVVLQKDFQQGKEFFNTIRRQIIDYITGRISGNIAALDRFFVVPPQFLELCVKVELTVGDYNQVFRAKRQVEERLRQFLDPISGNFDGGGWPIGTLPNATQLLNALRVIGHIKLINSVRYAAYTHSDAGVEEADLEKTEQWLYGLPLPGAHEVLISVDERR
jgi:hypothetical protein